MALRERKNDNNIVYDVQRTADSPDLKGNPRASNKPMIERRRRARINNSLTQLKTMVVDILNKQTNPKAKLEKADILEMTVKYIRSMQRQQITAATTTDNEVDYTSGFFSCTQEVASFLTNQASAIDEGTKMKLLDHLAGCMQGQKPKIAKQNASASTSARQGKVHVVSRQPTFAPNTMTSTPKVKMAATKTETTTSAGQENVAPENFHVPHVSPISRDVNSLVTPPPTATTQLGRCTPKGEPSHVLLSDQGQGWTRVPYLGGAVGHKISDAPQPAVLQPLQPVPMYAIPPGHFEQASHQHPHAAPSNFFGHALRELHQLNDNQAYGNDVWRPW